MHVLQWRNLSIFASDMKRLRYILAVALSLLIIYAGVGVSVVQYCCAGCEAAQSCCTTGCARCDKAHQQSDKSCKDEGCTATIYKVDLMKHSCEAFVLAPMTQLFCEQLPDFQCNSFVGEPQEVLHNIPPNPVSSRHYLTLYSILLI